MRTNEALWLNKSKKAARDYGTATFEGETYTLTSDPDLTNRVLNEYAYQGKDEESDMLEFSARGVDKDGEEVMVYWIHDVPHELEDMSDLDWSDKAIEKVVKTGSKKAAKSFKYVKNGNTNSRTHKPYRHAHNKTSDYQGWSNYETWNWNLWLGQDGSMDRYEDLAREGATQQELEDMMQSDCEENVPNISNSSYLDMLNASIREINWREIAKSIMDEIK
jgi:hypothetical protein